MKIQESAENYLETVLVLSKRNPEVRSIDVATELGFSKPSVSVAMKNLRNRDLIVMSDNGHISLTPEGQAMAETVYERHSLLSGWLIELGVDREIATADACKMEHDISEQTYTALCRHAIGNLGILGEDDAGLGETAGTDEN